MSLHLGAFVLSKSKRNMNIFIHPYNSLLTNDLYDTDTDSLIVEKKL